MHSFAKTLAAFAAASLAVIGANTPVMSHPSFRAAEVPAVAAPTATARAPAIRFETRDAQATIAFKPAQTLRSQIKFETVRWAGKRVQTLDEASRIQLAQAAAEKAGLDEVGLDYKDVYGVIEAETSWIPRTGMGNNGVASQGLAQFEPRTARGLGLKDPDDPVQAVFAAALNIRHGAEWAADRIDPLRLPPEQYAAKLREGVSVYYNLSVKGRNKWDGLNTAELPAETQRHIRNVRAGALEAQQLAHLLDT